LEIPHISEPFVDDASDYLPETLDSADLIIHICESTQAAELLFALAEKTGAKGIIGSTDHGQWIPKGLQLQINRELTPKGVLALFPQPFCALTEAVAGYGDDTVEYANEVISEFAHHFGWPDFEVIFEEDGETIADLDIRRGAPCGSTYYTAGRSKGLKKDEAVPTSGLRCLHYPCLASMQFIRKGEEIDTIMHTAGEVFNDAMNEAIERSETPERVRKAG
jgi:thymidylate synthase